MRRIALLSLLLLGGFLLVPPTGAAAKEVPLPERVERLDLAAFGAIPAQHEGRIKPLARVAQIELARLAKGQSLLDPLAWLVTALFDPQSAASLPVIRVAARDLVLQAQLPPRKDTLYSLEELAPFLSRTQAEALRLAGGAETASGAYEEAFLDLHERALGYNQILGTLTLFLPLEAEVPAAFAEKSARFKDRLIWLELRKKDQALREAMSALVKEKGEALDSYSEEEQKLARLSFTYHALLADGAQNSYLRLIPPQWDGDQSWLAPWALLQTGQGSPQTGAVMEGWQALVKAYYDGDSAAWARASSLIHEQTLALSREEGVAHKLTMERLYHQIPFFKVAWLCYGGALLLLGAGAFGSETKRGRLVQKAVKAAPLLILTGLAAQGTGNLLRVLILQRPPVGSLYETLLFVSMIIIAVALFIYAGRRDRRLLGAGSFAGFVILSLTPALAPAGDDLTVLVAVLNTNFWLATHVVIITTGYGVSVLAACMAHLYLFSRARRPMVSAAREDEGTGLVRLIYLLLVAALFFTAFGTVLGGVWADQSWGRFWGWDPKENGALLIVLWLIWLLHGRLSGHLRPLYFMIGAAFLNVIVALSWFGVNLLNIGLHSYGFTSGLAWGLGLFCGAEILLLTGLGIYARRYNVSFSRVRS